VPDEPLTGARYPASSDAPNVPQDIQNAVWDLAGYTKPRFTSTAERDTQFAAFVAGGGVLQAGFECHTSDAGGGTWTYSGSAWVLTRPTVPPRFRGRRAALQSIPNATETTVTWTAEDYDTANGHASTGTTYVIPITGWYQVQASVGYDFNATGIRIAVLRLDGVNIQGTLGTTTPMTSAYNGMAVTPARRIYCTVGQTIDVRTWQNSGGALDTTFGVGAAAPTFEVMWDGAN
jgi:hypothetical protein